MSQPTTAALPANGATAPDALEIRDNRTGTSYSAPIRTEGPEGDTYIRASDIKQVKREAGEFGTLSYDPAFMNTASCRSAITFIDGDKGILRYRGYPIEQLAENATFLEVAYLLRHGNLPDQKQYDTWVHDITFHTYVHENIRKFLEGFRYDAHPYEYALQRHGGTVELLSAGARHSRPAPALYQHDSPHGEAADHCGSLRTGT
ncbi:citrate/2-methylcitrate synthase [Gemmatimonas sp.]|uniref:citrate/2-methylcitrate synthase n=1 Tax=Gemmatimonas sp. TaxID=1962908 RepID=UPI003DA39564